MPHVEGLCSNARPNDPITFDDNVPGGGAKSFTFIVVPLQTGKFPVSVYMFSTYADDAVEKILNVVVSELIT